MSETTTAQGAPDPSHRDVIARINRFSSLRSAERALNPSVRRRRELPSARVGRELLARLRRLLEQTQDEHARKENTPPAAAELTRIDERLDLLARQLRATTDRSHMAQLRATLPCIAREHPDEVAALLDLCLEAEEPVAARLPMVDYLITLLASDDNTRKSLARDPSEVSREVARRCRRLAKEPEEASRQAEQIFDQAAQEVSGLDNVDAVVRRTREYKGELDERIFIPNVLRSIVRYNLAVNNRIDALLEREREQARHAETMFLALDTPDNDKKTREHRRATAPSALDSPALIALHEALSDVLSGYELPEDPAAKLAASFNLADLDDHEVRAFTEPNADYEQVNRLLRLTVTAGLARRALPTLNDALYELDVDAVTLTEKWIPELSQQLDAAIERLLSASTGQSTFTDQLRTSQRKFLAV